MKSAFRAFLIACALLLGAPAIPAAIQSVVITSASAGTYEDNVFRPGEPRWGSSPRHWHYEDRNLRGTGSANWGGHRAVHGRTTHSREVEVSGFRRLIGVRRYAAPVAQEQPRARCGGSCTVARPTCGSRCRVVAKPRCSTCGIAAPRQTNTAKVSGIKSVVKGDGNTVTQTVTVNQTNIIGGTASARSTTSSSTSRTCPSAQGAQYIKTENGREVWSWNGQARLMKPKRNDTAVACVVGGVLGWSYASN